MYNNSIFILYLHILMKMQHISSETKLHTGDENYAKTYVIIANQRIFTIRSKNIY